MADTKITDDPLASALDGTEDVPLVQGGTNKRVKPGKISSRQKLVLDTVGVASSSNAEVKMKSGLLIPANTVVAGNILLLQLRSVKSGTNALVNVRAYFNTSDAIGGSLIHNTTGGSAANIYQQTKRTIVVKSSTTELLHIGSFNASDDTFLSLAGSTFSIDWTVDQYLIVTLQQGGTLDTTTLSLVQLELIR